MEIIPVNNTAPFPLPLYSTARVGSARSSDGEGFLILAGLDKGLVAQLKKFSLDTSDAELQRTSDRERFGGDSYQAWYEKSRTPFALVHEKTGALAAIAWFGPKPLGRKPLNRLSAAERTEEYRRIDSQNWHVIAYRSYPPFRGKGLMKGFTKFAMDAYAGQHPGANFWAGIDTENIGSIALAEGLGFSPDEGISDRTKHWLVMVKRSNIFS
ncbi:N-acetyltransferase [Candidatus Parcubacteria bacterium]|nr:MAG: N-acetyltransferase [Candidatus Parcubacteria bacterium]